jgi:hypothetical protein
MIAIGVRHTAKRLADAAAPTRARDQVVVQLETVEHGLQARIERFAIDPLLLRGKQVGTIEARVRHPGP